VITREESAYSIKGFGFERGWYKVTGVSALFRRPETDSCIILHKNT
jgi:hypothetical protein